MVLGALLVIGVIAGLVAGLSSGSSSGSPASAAQSFVEGYLAENSSQACGAAMPSQRAACVNFLGQVGSYVSSQGITLSGSLKASNYMVQGDKAIVAFVGQTCAQGPMGRHCSTYQNPSAGLPSSTDFQGAWRNLTSVNFVANTQNPDLPCIRINGHWYVALNFAGAVQMG